MPTRHEQAWEKVPAMMMSICRSAASGRFTLCVIFLVAIGALCVYGGVPFGDGCLILALACALVNLAMALVLRQAFRGQHLLLVFHLGLAAIVILLLLSRLTYLEGRLELGQGEWFSGDLLESSSGPLHRSHLDDVEFTNDGFVVDYLPGLQRNRTVNWVTWRDDSGHLATAYIGDQIPLVIGGYRFYTTPNKGFALTFTWLGNGAGAADVGTVHLPRYPGRQYEQAQSWVLPGTRTEVWAMLVMDEQLVRSAEAFQLKLPDRHHIIIRAAGVRSELHPGDELRLAQGTLRYEGLSMWMGYRVFYDWARPWLVASCLVTIAAMSLHYAGTFWSRFPWRQTIVGQRELSILGD